MKDWLGGQKLCTVQIPLLKATPLTDAVTSYENYVCPKQTAYNIEIERTGRHGERETLNKQTMLTS